MSETAIKQKNHTDMKDQLRDLIEAENATYDYRYIADVIQNGRIRPSTFVHEIIVPSDIYQEMKNLGLIDHQYLALHRIAFFQFKSDRVIVSFCHMYNCEDFHNSVDRFLIVKHLGSYPITRTGVSKMNFDNAIEPVSHVVHKTVLSAQKKTPAGIKA